MDDLEQQILARMSTALQGVDDLDHLSTTFFACRDAISFDRLAAKAISDERYRRELAEAEVAKDLTP
jgi:hypothetical protein